MKFFLKSGVKPCKHTNLYQFNKYTFFWKKNVDNIKANQKDDEYLYSRKTSKISLNLQQNLIF